MKKLVSILAMVILAVAAMAEIDYPVDVDHTRWALYDVSTGEVIHRQQVWPRADGMPVEGLSTNFVYLLHITQAAPQYDSRVFVLHSTEEVDPDANEIRKAHETVRRPTEEIAVAAQNREMEEVEKQGVDLAREAIETRLMLAALIQFSIDGQTLPPKVRTFANNYKDKGVRLWKNRDRLEALIEKINANEDFDLDAGWEAAQ